jgi:hypothetical protein
MQGLTVDRPYVGRIERGDERYLIIAWTVMTDVPEAVGP